MSGDTVSVSYTHRHTSSICCFWHGRVSRVSSGNYGEMASHTQPSIILLTHTASPHSLQMRAHTPCQNTHTSLSRLIRFSIHASRIGLGITLLRIQPSRGGLPWLVWRANKDAVFGGNSHLNLCNSLKSQPEIQTIFFLNHWRTVLELIFGPSMLPTAGSMHPHLSLTLRQTETFWHAVMLQKNKPHEIRWGC